MMNPRNRQRTAVSRMLVAAELLMKDVPSALRTVSGTPDERIAQRMEAAAEVLEYVVLENIQPGLGALLSDHGLTEITLLRSVDDEDLLSIDGVGPATVDKLRKGLDIAAPKADGPEPGLSDGVTVEVVDDSGTEDVDAEE